jgi:hypothetical protein
LSASALERASRPIERRDRRAKEHGAEQRAPGQKKNRNAINHCFTATGASVRRKP